MKKSDWKLFNFLILCIILIGLAVAIQKVHITFRPPPKVNKTPEPARLTYIPQFVLISFDGSRAIDEWQDLRSFKNEMKAAGKPVHFTFFINAAYFLTANTKKMYKGPGKPEGTSDIGFGANMNDVRARVNEVNLAIADGDEIQPHTVGHFSGKNWTRDEWKLELQSFSDIMLNLDTVYPNENFPRVNLSAADFNGFRAPYLDVSPGLYDALHDLHFSYDTSGVGAVDEWPKRDAAGMWRLPLGTLFIGERKTPVLAMDYNLYVHHTRAESVLKKGTREWQAAYDETLQGWMDYFTRNYTGNRAPVLVGYHFSMRWNDGVYWEALKEFTRRVCGQPEVRCGTFKELVEYMEEGGVEEARQSEGGVL